MKSTRAHASPWAQVKVALGRFSRIVDDSDRKLSQRRVGGFVTFVGFTCQ